MIDAGGLVREDIWVDDVVDEKTGRYTRDQASTKNMKFLRAREYG